MTFLLLDVKHCSDENLIPLVFIDSSILRRNPFFNESAGLRITKVSRARVKYNLPLAEEHLLS